MVHKIKISKELQKKIDKLEVLRDNADSLQDQADDAKRDVMDMEDELREETGSEW